MAAKWFLPAEAEPLAAEARGILKQFAKAECHLLVADLFWAELGNILWKAVRSGRISADTCQAAMERLETVGLTTSSRLPFFHDALKIALSFDRTMYDSIYVALALGRNVPLLTADERVANSLGARFPVRWLGALSL